jgi:hypothetical protein
MVASNYSLLSAFIFTLVAVLQLVRAIKGWPAPSARSIGNSSMSGFGGLMNCPIRPWTRSAKSAIWFIGSGRPAVISSSWRVVATPQMRMPPVAFEKPDSDLPRFCLSALFRSAVVRSDFALNSSV